MSGPLDVAGVEDWKVALQKASAANDTARPRFYYKDIWDKKERKYRQVEMVEVVTQSDHLNIPHLRVREDHKIRWKAQYDHWKQFETNTVEGTPLKEWGIIPREKALELFNAGIQTVEELADLGDQRIPKFTDWGALREHAKNWLLEKDKGVGIAKLQDKVDKLSSDVDKLMEANQLLMAENKQLRQPPEIAPEQLKVTPVQQDLDDHGTAFDPNIHDLKHVKNKDGSWRKKVGMKRRNT